MRIVSGFARGRRLCSPLDGAQTIRPTSDRAREALFNIIGNKIRDGLVLDLFSGTGAFGLEAFSRGAAFVTMVDESSMAIELIKTNVLKILKGYSGEGQIRVMQHRLFAPLFKEKLPEETSKGFDLIFADPPYGQELSTKTLDFINNSRLLRDNGVLIVEEKHDLVLPQRLPNLRCIDKRSYGKNGFYFYQSPSSL